MTLFQISLVDKYAFEDDHKCVCYQGTPDVFTCCQCKVYTRTFDVIQYNQPISEPEFDFKERPLILG